MNNLENKIKCYQNMADAEMVKLMESIPKDKLIDILEKELEKKTNIDLTTNQRIALLIPFEFLEWLEKFDLIDEYSEYKSYLESI